jgi:hypothetical protein
MVIVKGDDPGATPDEEMLTTMGKYNEQLVEAGVMKDGNGLLPSSIGHRVQFGVGGDTSVVDGPFSESKELIAGYWIFECDTIQDAVAWARKAPFPDGQVLEIRKVASAEDFGEAYTPEVAEQEDLLRQQLASQNSGA